MCVCVCKRWGGKASGGGSSHDSNMQGGGCTQAHPQARSLSVHKPRHAHERRRPPLPCAGSLFIRCAQRARAPPQRSSLCTRRHTQRRRGRRAHAPVMAASWPLRDFRLKSSIDHSRTMDWVQPDKMWSSLYATDVTRPACHQQRIARRAGECILSSVQKPSSQAERVQLPPSAVDARRQPSAVSSGCWQAAEDVAPPQAARGMATRCSPETKSDGKAGLGARHANQAQKEGHTGARYRTPRARDTGTWAEEGRAFVASTPTVTKKVVAHLRARAGWQCAYACRLCGSRAAAPSRLRTPPCPRPAAGRQCPGSPRPPAPAPPAAQSGGMSQRHLHPTAPAPAPLPKVGA